MKSLFRALEDEDKDVTYATFQFKGTTKLWYGNNVEPVTYKPIKLI